MNLPKLPLLMLLSLLSLGACGGGGDPDDTDAGDGSNGSDNTDGSDGSGEKLYTCSASVSPATLNYTLDGDVLTISTPGQPDVVLPRVGPGDGLFDAWQGPDFAAGSLSGTLTVTLTETSVISTTECKLDGQVKATVSAEGRATYTPTTITILEGEEVVEEF